MSKIALGDTEISGVVSASGLDTGGLSRGESFFGDGFGGVSSFALFNEETVFDEVKLTASDGAPGDRFGYSVAVGSGRIVVGAAFDDDNGSDSGSAYIFDLDGNELSKITASDGAADDYFGYSVAVGSGRIVVGARDDDDNGLNSGSAYIFDLDGNELSKITASDGDSGDIFGSSVAVGSGRIVVGAYQHDDNGSFLSGSAYIFDLDGNQLSKVTASDGAAYDRFGISVAVGSNRILIGLYPAPSDPFAPPGSFEPVQGAAYIYETSIYER